MAEHELVPKTIDSMVTDVIEEGEIKVFDAESLELLQARTGKVWPAPPGVRIGHFWLQLGRLEQWFVINLTRG